MKIKNKKQKIKNKKQKIKMYVRTEVLIKLQSDSTRQT